MEGYLCFYQTNNQTKALHWRGMQSFLVLATLASIKWSSRPVMSCVLYRFPHKLPKNETIRQYAKCQVWVVQRVCWPPSLPRWHLLHQIKSGPATLWAPVLVLVGGLWTFLDKGEREAPTDIADPQSRHWKKRNTHSCVNSLNNN